MSSVHSTHCCTIHGCKYGDDDCPVVVLQTEAQEHPCQDCHWQSEQGFLEGDEPLSRGPELGKPQRQEYPPMFQWLVLDSDGNTVESNPSKAGAIGCARDRWEYESQRVRVVKVEIIDELDPSFWEDE